MVKTAEGILTSKVPPVFDLSARIAQGKNEGQSFPLDFIAHEESLRDLIRTITTTHQDLPPTGLRTEELDRIEDLPNGGWKAIAPMAFCPESVLIVHSPIVIGRVLALAEAVLPKDNPIVGIENVRFKKPLRHDVALQISPATEPVPANAEVSGRLLGRSGQRWLFSATKISNRPVSRWIDNAECTHSIDIQADPEAVITRFNLKTIGYKNFQPTKTEAVQVMMEGIIRAIVSYRGLDGRALLLNRMNHFSWPDDLANKMIKDCEATVTARPGKKLGAESPWRALEVKLTGDLGEGSFGFVEGHTTLTELVGSAA